MPTNLTLTYSSMLCIVTCPTCSTVHAIPTSLNERMTDRPGPSGKSAFCPNGHQWCYVGLSEADKLRKQLERANARAQAAKDQAAAAERSKANMKGQMTKARKRAAAGVCLCCHRSFSSAQMTRHMKTQHPTFDAEVTV